MVCSLSLVVACSPYYVDEIENESPMWVIATVSSETELAAPGVLLIVQADWKGGCAQGVGQAVAAYPLYGSDHSRGGQAVWPCSSFRPSNVAEVGEFLRGAGYTDNPLEARRTPCYGAQGPSRCTELHSSILETAYVAYNDAEIQVVTGSFGNRSGSEVEHTYRVSESHEIETIRATTQTVDYDRLPDWW